MKIIVTDLAGVQAALTLGDDSVGDYIVDPPPVPTETRQAQHEPLAFGARQFSYGRGNALIKFSWTVERVHADIPTSTLFAWNHAAVVAWNVSIAIMSPTVVATFMSAVIPEVAVLEQCGCSTKTRYTAEGCMPGPVSIPGS